MSYRKIPKDKILKFPSTAGFRGWRSFFTDDSTTHPAKMNLNLLRHIIKTYTKMGDVILDPMAGTGSTIILAALEGRHGIAVEYEEHFCKMIRDNIKLTEKRGSISVKPRGKMFCIQGDARELSKLLKKSDVVITSPPYSGRTEHRLGYDYQKRDEERGHKAYKGHRESYSADPNNISNLPHGNIETIITSPPYSGQKRHSEFDLEKEVSAMETDTRPDTKRRHTPGRIRGIKTLKDGYSSDPQNIGNLPHGNIETIITSPPYGSDNANLRERKDKSAQSVLATTGVRAVSLEEDNIGVLEYGDVDAIITSPPYSEGTGHGGPSSEKIAREKKLHLRGAGSYTEPVDVLISSPPYADSVKRGDEGPSAHGEERPTYEERLTDPKVYSNDPKNIGNLRHGEINSIVTSPPYEGSSLSGGDVEKRKERLEEKYGDLDKRRKTLQKDGKDAHYTFDKGILAQEHYSSDSDNIGNLKSESYLEAMLQCYREFYKVLKNSGKLILVTKNFIRNKQVVRLDEDTIKLCEASGFTLKDRWYFRLPQISFWRILYRKKFPSVSQINYEDVLIFEKADK